MKVRFLGTSHGVPEKHRHCQSILIETAKGLYLVDGGAPVMDCMDEYGYDVNLLRAVFVTHVHTDHVDGLTHLLALTTWYYTKTEYTIYMPEQRGIDGLVNYCKEIMWHSQLPDRIKFRIVEEGALYDDGNLRVTAVHSEHMRVQTGIAFGYLLECDGERVYITGDLYDTLEDFPEFLNRERVDLLAIECAHFFPDLLCKVIRNCKADKVAVIHTTDERRETLREMGKDMPFQFVFPKDGDEYSLGK